MWRDHRSHVHDEILADGSRNARTPVTLWFVTQYAHTSASFAFTARCRLANRPGTLGKLTTRLGEAGGDLRAIDIVRVETDYIVRDLTVLCSSDVHAHQLVELMKGIDGVEVIEYSDRTFLAHLGGKISVESRLPLKTRDDLSMVYTPGVARISRAIADHPERARNLTIKRNCIAIVSDGSAVLGLGNLGPAASLPVLEGKAMLFKEFGGVNAFPIALDVHGVDEIVAVTRAIAPVFGGINLEDISAPRCFEIERRLREELEIPVFHDDQHGTAVVVAAALINALKVVGKELKTAKIVLFGIGAAGTAIARLLLAAGAWDITPVDREGILEADGASVSETHAELARLLNPRRVRGSVRDALQGADVFIGTSSGGSIERTDLEVMAPRSVVFALANPTPEISPETAHEVVEVVATGRSDYPNQINNVLCFPGFFRGLLDCGASAITEGMEVAAAHAIAEIVTAEELSAEYIIPSVFNRQVAGAVAAAVSGEAERAGVSQLDMLDIDPLHD